MSAAVVAIAVFSYAASIDCSSTAQRTSTPAVRRPVAVQPATSPAPNSPIPGVGWFGSDSNSVFFIQWTEVNGQLAGQRNEVVLQSGVMQPKVVQAAVTGTHQGSSVVFTGALSSVRGTFSGNQLTLTYGQADGTIASVPMKQGTPDDYNAAVKQLRADWQRVAGNIADTISSHATAETKASCALSALTEFGTKATILFDGTTAVRDCEVFLIEGGARRFSGTDRGVVNSADIICSGVYGQASVAVWDSEPAQVGRDACAEMGIATPP